MSNQQNKCLFCQGENTVDTDTCQHCGMTLPKKHPEDRKSKISFFVKAFWAIVIFCTVMVFYLPR
ncbi:DnrP protein [Colwellia sp. KU-HH00111]|uniref:DnrP protein n=1 Tax=Colwellia sp. KU-HH00111 TaxID=3127652 RepID=UPI0033654494